MVMMATARAAQEEKYDRIIRSYVGEKLRRNGINLAGYTREEQLQTEIALTLRRVGDELESANSEFFAHMCDQLQITANTAYTTFQSISDEIFASGKNWGRIVAFLTFGSNLAVHCALRDDLGVNYVDRVVEWISRYMAINLDNWMTQNGSWDGFLDFFDKTNTNSGNHGFIVSALAGLGIGALLMMTFK